MKHRSSIILILFFISSLALDGQNTKPISPISLNSRLELFVDGFIIDKLSGNAELKLHHPVPQEIVMTFDEPWEGSGCGFRSIFKDGDKYKMYYESWHHTASRETSKIHPQFHAYAESYDGIHWIKPNLGLHSYAGNKDNNIVFVSGKKDGFVLEAAHMTILKDENPNVLEDQAYKAFVYSSNPRGLIAYKSPDGLNWSLLNKEPVITDGAFDSQNLGFWDPTIGKYRAYWRFFDKGSSENRYVGLRSIRTAVSSDFINWENQKDLEYINSPPEQLYTNQVQPYYRAPHILIGFPMRYIERGWSESMRLLPELEEREFRSSQSMRYGVALTESLFMSSRDGHTFNRWNEAFVRPGIERLGSWTYGDNMMGWQVVETKSSLAESAPNELSLYVTENYWKGTASSLRRYTLRIDGFVSVNSSMDGGEVLTKALNFNGSNLFINFSSSAAGTIYIELLDVNGNPIKGFTYADCDPIFGDSIERVVSWNGSTDVSSLEGKDIRIKFTMYDADLYSFQFK